jgi:uncharacterized membrane protein
MGGPDRVARFAFWASMSIIDISWSHPSETLRSRPHSEPGKVLMSLAPLLDAAPAIPLHAFAAMSAFVLGLVQFAAPKGTLPHRTLGWIWVLLMASVAVSSFWIHQIRLVGPWSPIHLLSIFTLAAARFRKPRGALQGGLSGARFEGPARRAGGWRKSLEKRTENPPAGERLRVVLTHPIRYMIRSKN